MAQHQPRLTAWIVAVEGMHIRTANSGGGNADHHLITAFWQLRIRPFLYFNAQRAGIDESFHASSLNHDRIGDRDTARTMSAPPQIHRTGGADQTDNQHVGADEPGLAAERFREHGRQHGR